jgi:hypothetical protein
MDESNDGAGGGGESQVFLAFFFGLSFYIPGFVFLVFAWNHDSEYWAFFAGSFLVWLGNLFLPQPWDWIRKLFRAMGAELRKLGD